jgi:hypothetical protein
MFKKKRIKNCFTDCAVLKENCLPYTETLILSLFLSQSLFFISFKGVNRCGAISFQM